MPRTVTLLFIRRNLFTWNSAGGLTGYWRVEFSSKTCRICQRPSSFATPAGFTRIKPNPVNGIDIVKMSIRSGQNLFSVLTGEKCWRANTKSRLECLWWKTTLSWRTKLHERNKRHKEIKVICSTNKPKYYKMVNWSTKVRKYEAAYGKYGFYGHTEKCPWLSTC